MGTRPDLGEASAESGEHFLHVAPFLHGDDPQVVLLVDPHQESLIVIVPGKGVQSSQNPSQNTVLDHIQNDTVWVTLKQKASQVTEVLILERYRSVSCRQTPIPATLEEGWANGAPITWCVAGEGLKQAEQPPGGSTPPPSQSAGVGALPGRVRRLLRHWHLAESRRGMGVRRRKENKQHRLPRDWSQPLNPWRLRPPAAQDLTHLRDQGHLRGGLGQGDSAQRTEPGAQAGLHPPGGTERGRARSYHIPRASGQSRAMPEASSRGDTGLSKRK